MYLCSNLFEYAIEALEKHGVIKEAFWQFIVF